MTESKGILFFSYDAYSFILYNVLICKSCQKISEGNEDSSVVWHRKLGFLSFLLKYSVFTILY